jgi:hypothetical protein
VDDVFQGRLVLLLRLDQLRPVAPAEKMVLAAVLLVEGACIAAVQIPHARVEVRGRGLHNEVVVVSHQAARVQAPAVAPFDASEEVEEDDAVFAVERDRRAVVPAGHDVVVAPGHERSVRSSHSGDRSSARGRSFPACAFCRTSASDQSRARHETGVNETALIGACRSGVVRVGLGRRATRRLWSARGADATGSSHGPAAAFAGTACLFASWRGSGRPRRRARPTRFAPR